MKVTDRNKFLFIPVLAVMGVIYSALFPVNQMSVEAGLPYIGYAFWFNLLATLVLFAFAAYRRELPRLTWPHLRAYVLLGIVAVAVPVPLLTFLADKVPVGIITLLMVLVPLITYVLSYFLRIEKFRASGVIGLLLGLAGLLFVLVPEAGLPAPEMVGWTLLALVAPLCFALSNAFVTILRPPGTPSLMMGAGDGVKRPRLRVPDRDAGQQFADPLRHRDYLGHHRRLVHPGAHHRAGVLLAVQLFHRARRLRLGLFPLR